MPSYTLGEIMSHATTGAGRRADLDASYVSFMANEAGMQVADAYPLVLSEKTAYLSFASGTATASLPTDCGDVLALSHYSGGSATTLRLAAITEIDSSGTGGGTMAKFAFFGDGVEVRPVPNSAQTALLRYRARWEDLVSTSSVPTSIATRWRPAIVMKLKEKIHLEYGNASGAAAAAQELLNFAASTPSDAAHRQAGYPQGVRVVGYDD